MTTYATNVRASKTDRTSAATIAATLPPIDSANRQASDNNPAYVTNQPPEFDLKSFKSIPADEPTPPATPAQPVLVWHAARLLGVTKKRIYQLMHEGRLDYENAGRRQTRISRESLNAEIERRKNQKTLCWDISQN